MYIFQVKRIKICNNFGNKQNGKELIAIDVYIHGIHLAKYLLFKIKTILGLFFICLFDNILINIF